jgi:hypothetical protein
MSQTEEGTVAEGTETNENSVSVHFITFSDHT